MKLPALPRKLTPEELKLATAIAAVVSALATLITVFTASRLIWQLFRFLKEARKTLPTLRRAAEIYIDERDAPAPAGEEAAEAVPEAGEA